MNRPNVICPSKECCQGTIEAHPLRLTPEGEVCTNICPVCAGHGFITAEENDKYEAPIQRKN